MMKKKIKRSFLLITIGFFILTGCAGTAVKSEQKQMQINKQKKVVLPPVPEMCGGQSVFYGVVKEYSPKSDGFYLDRFSNYTDINLQNINDPSLLGKTILVVGERHSLYPPGGTPVDDNHHSIIQNPEIIQVGNSNEDLWQASKKCTALNAKLKIEQPERYKALFP